MLDKYFDLKVGFSCNNDCIHCVVADKRSTSDLSTDEIKKIIDGVSKEFTIGFTGGEASIRKDFIEILKYAKEAGHEVALQTNGTGFANDAIAKEASKYLDGVLIAIHSSNPDIHNEIVQAKTVDMFDLTIKGLKNIIKYNIPVCTQTVISTLNYTTLPETSYSIHKLVPHAEMNLTYPHPMGSAYNKDICPSYTQIHPYIQKVLEKYAPLLNVEAIPMCHLYPYHDKIRHNFDSALLENEEQRVGIDPANKNNEFFNSEGYTPDYFSSMRAEKRKHPDCRQCSFSKKCVGVWKEYMEFYGKELDLHPFIDDSKKNTASNGAIIIYGREKCLNTCVFCAGVSNKQTDLERFNQFVADAKYFIDNNYRHVEISGGDPGEFLYIAEAIMYLTDNGIESIQLSTHGRTLADEELVKRLAAAGLTRARIPLYGSNAFIHNKTADKDNPASSAFDDTCLAIKNCVKYGISICGQTIINEYNKDDMVNIIELYKNLTNCYMTEMIVNLAYITTPTKEYVGDWYIPMKDIGMPVKKIIDANIQFSDEVRFKIFDVPYCVIGEYSDLIEQSIFSNLGTHKVELQNRSKEDDGIPSYRIRSHFDECEKCVLKTKCVGITNNDQKMFGHGNLKAITNV